MSKVKCIVPSNSLSYIQEFDLHHEPTYEEVSACIMYFMKRYYSPIVRQLTWTYTEGNMVVEVMMGKIVLITLFVQVELDS